MKIHPKLADKLYRDFKQFWPEVDGREYRPGLDIGSGWFPLLYFTLRRASEICDGQNLTIKINYIKEKYGGLAIEFDTLSDSDELMGLFELAEEESYKICDACGRAGKLVQRGRWCMTRCSDHHSDNVIFSREVMDLLNQHQGFVCNLKDKVSLKILKCTK